MKILVIGGNGTIGKVVSKVLKEKHEVIIAGRSAGDVIMDIADSESIKQGLETIGMLDAIVCIAGEARWADFESMTEEDFYIGIRSKLMGQVNLVRLGTDYLHDQGSITLSTGVLADDPVVKTTSAAMVNGAIHSFARAAQLEMKRDLRINVVCLGLVADAYEKYKDYFPGHTPISMRQTSDAYLKSIEGKKRGEIIRVY